MCGGPRWFQHAELSQDLGRWVRRKGRRRLEKYRSRLKHGSDVPFRVSPLEDDDECMRLEYAGNERRMKREERAVAAS